MSSPAARSREDRVLVRDGRRHHRRTYSRAELRIGIACLVVLALVGAWVAWRGAHPDPALFDAPVDFTVTPGGDVPADVASRAAGDRGPLPQNLVLSGWSETGVTTFGFDDLYVKINGREGYYKQFGFERLWFVSLTADDDPATVIDVEVYDLAETANALGAAMGERPEDVAAEIDEQGLTLLYRNALYLTRGQFYIRAIGSDESAQVVAQLRELRLRLDSEITGEPLPWAWALFAAELGIDPGSISYVSENAFSFGFAKDVYVATRADETELFVIATESEGAAASLVTEFEAGFRGYGSDAGRSSGVSWVQDRYIATLSGAKAIGPWTFGVRGAPDLATAESALQELERAVRNISENGS